MYGKTKAGVGLPVLVDSSGRFIEAGGGQYREGTVGGNQFFAFSASQNMAFYTATAAIGLIIYNPIGSGVNAVFGKWCVNVWATSATTTGIVLASQAQTITPTTVTAATAWGKCLLTPPNFGAGKCLAYSIATIQTAPLMVWNLVHNTAAIAITGVDNMSGDLQGAFAAGPGTVTLIGALAVASVTSNQGIMWEEVPV